MKNYIIKFMDKSSLRVTAEEAAKIAIDWRNGVALVMINGNLKATHQICSIDRVDAQEEKDLCSIAGINYQDVPRIENILQKSISSPKPNEHKLLT